MIRPDYCRLMARYSVHQNKAQSDAVQSLSDEDLRKDRGAFFGSIFATMNHLLWADCIWLARFRGVDTSELSGVEHTELTADLAEWNAARAETNKEIIDWAHSLDQSDLEGILRWTSGLDGSPMEDEMALCVVHFFSHQTHHRGQIHAMLTGAGLKLPDTDITYLTED